MVARRYLADAITSCRKLRMSLSHFKNEIGQVLLGCLAIRRHRSHRRNRAADRLNFLEGKRGFTVPGGELVCRRCLVLWS